ncbi:MAG: hypothetical protein ABIP35_03115 [Ginsengibacter sp.]
MVSIKNQVFFLTVIFVIIFNLQAQTQSKIFAGADESTPSRSEYFSWINNTNEGSTEKQTLINVDFFKWLKDKYGMQLDIYALDAGNIDGKGFCGNMESSRFLKQFPNSFDLIFKKASSINTRLGIWGGPDCFGNTLASQTARIDMMVKLCRQYKFELFKFDKVNGDLRTEKQDAFIEMMEKCRKYSPDLILLNHRLNLGKALPYATTSLLGGAETYIDVHMTNSQTAPHHRQGALAREGVPGLKRLTEDHGVCISSCLDYWEDDIVLQAFNRNLILAPEIYGNPWLLKDEEFSKLARLFNLHAKYNKLLVNGMLLPENNYGENAVSRGDSSTRFITLRNLSWQNSTYTISLDQEIGLTKGNNFIVRQFHPYEEVIGHFEMGQKIKIEVLPFRSCLIGVSPQWDEPGIEGCRYEIINQKGDEVQINLLGMPGEKVNMNLSGYSSYLSATIDCHKESGMIRGAVVPVSFPGPSLKESWHRALDDFISCEVPDDAESLYEATCFAADNNALEVRSLYRSGKSDIPQVIAARNALFDQPLFKERGIWDKYLFDNDLSSGFEVSHRWGTLPKGVFRLDLGKNVSLDKLVLEAGGEYNIPPLKTDEAISVEISTDLKTWKVVEFLAGKTMVIKLDPLVPVRYFRFNQNFESLLEIKGYLKGKSLNRSNWRASNLFANWRVVKAEKAWESSFVLNEIPKGSYLCIALDGKHGVEGAYAAIRVDGKPIGAPDRTVSFPGNTWELSVSKNESNYTYYIPLSKDMENKKIDAVVLGLKEGVTDFKPKVWITAYPIPFEKKSLVLKRNKL